MDYMAYKLTWHLVLEHTFCGTFIKAVYGSALLEDAVKKASSMENCEIRSLSAYGWPFHAGQKFNF